MLVRAVSQPWAPAYALTLYGVPGCNFAGVQNGLPYFEVPGHGVQGLTLEQAKQCKIVRMSEHEAGTGSVKKLRPK